MHIDRTESARPFTTLLGGCASRGPADCDVMCNLNRCNFFNIMET